MKIDIWSDVMCPFCYIGKRKFESALEEFEHKDHVIIEWHSFQLDPAMKTQPDKNVYDYLAERKGQSREWSVQMHDHVTKIAAEVGLQYNFDKAVVANSFDAHRFTHLAKKHCLGDAAEEQLFKAYFTEGKNTADHDTLIQLGIQIGLSATETCEMLNSDAYTTDVQKDIELAEALGIRGVPFFVLNNRYGVSGAQAPETFLNALQQAWSEHQKQYPQLTDLGNTDAGVCEPGGDCN